MTNILLHLTGIAAGFVAAIMFMSMHSIDIYSLVDNHLDATLKSIVGLTTAVMPVLTIWASSKFRVK